MAREIPRSRYARLGGLARVIRRYEQRDLKFREIGEAVGCSHEAVRNDFIRFLGQPDYARLRKRIKRPAVEDKCLNIQAAKHLIEERLPSLTEEEQKKATVLSNVLIQAEKSGVQFAVVVKGSGSFRFFLPDGRPISIRVAIPSSDLKEYPLGLHRFKVTPTISSFAFVIFAMLSDQNVVTYIFDTSEINRIRTLALRFKWLERRSKYDSARNRWSLLLNKNGSSSIKT
jgi:hypothetical protein